jgi:hypothetical protein
MIFLVLYLNCALGFPTSLDCVFDFFSKEDVFASWRLGLAGKNRLAERSSTSRFDLIIYGESHFPLDQSLNVGRARIRFDWLIFRLLQQEL